MGGEPLSDITAALQNASLGIVVVDPDERYVWVNRGFCELVGYSSEELIGTSSARLTHPDDSSFGRDLVDRARRGELNQFRTRNRRVRKDGSVFIGDMIVSVWTEDGVTMGGIGVMVDAGGADTTTRRIESLQRSAALGELTTAVVHDLRNNIAAVGLAGDTLAARYGRQPETELLEYEVEHTRSLLNSIMDYVDPDDGPTHFDTIGEVLERAKPLLRLAVPAGVELDVLSVDPSITPSIESRQMQQVLTNLVLNARDATHADGGRISIAAGALANDPDSMELVVADDGSGMTDDELGRAFEAYFTTKGDNGTGLGLTICRDIVERNGGHISAASSPGKGSTFTIRIPQHVPDRMVRQSA